MIEKILLFVIISFSFLVITKDFMDIYLERKSIPISRRICIWVAFYLMEAIGTEYIKLPVLVLCFQVLLSFFLSCVLYKGGLRKKVFLVFIINVIGMLTEIFVGFVFMFMNLQMTDSINMLGSILSKIIQFMLVICLKIFSSRLKREIDVKHWVILLAVPAGSIIVLNTLFMASETQTENFLETMISSVLILGLNLSIFRIYEDLSEKFELKKQQGIFLKEIELYKNQMEEREKTFRI